MTNQQTTAIVKKAQFSSLHTTALSASQLAEASDPPLSIRYLCLSESALKQGVHICGESGSGKSFALAYVFAWRKILQENDSLVLIDPTGAVADFVFNKIVQLPWEVQPELWQRIHYIDSGNNKHIVPTLAYYRQSPSETLFEIANRLPAVLKKQDPDLQSAPILGWNSLYECAIHAGMIAAALGRQLDFVMDLIDHPQVYKIQLKEALSKYPELQRAVTYFREMMDPKSANLREKRTGSFKNKLLPFLADPTLLATFAGTRKRLNWEKELGKRRKVIIDLRNERDADRKQFKMIWYLKTFIDYIKYRGMAGRGQEVTLIIDEITDMLGQRTKDGRSILAEDMEELITRLGRNMGVNVIAAHQNLSQLDERMQNVLMAMGTQIIGHLKNPNDAERIARQFLQYRPYWVKREEKVWMSVRFPAIYAHFGFPEDPIPLPIDKKFIDFSPEEQLLMLVNKLQRLGRFRFLTKTATREGDLRGTLQKISIAELDRNQYPNEAILAPLRRQLAQRDGVPVETLLAEIRANQIRETSQKTNKQVQAPKEPARLNTTHDSTNRIPSTPAPAPPVSAPRKEPRAASEPNDEPIFQ
jgi:hypothetical protein